MDSSRIIGGICLFFLSLTLFIVVYYYAINNRVSDKDIAKTEHYVAFFNGQEVDIENVDLNQYDCSYDHKNKEVYLTNKSSSSSSGSGIEWMFISQGLR